MTDTKNTNSNLSERHTKPRDEFLSAPHSFSATQITAALNVDPAVGLSNKEAQLRFERDGANTLEQSAGRGWLSILLGQFSSIIVWLLAFAAVVAWFTDSRLESLAILVVLLLNAIIGFAIESQAGRALNALRRSAQTSARIRRDGGGQIVEAAPVVVGDIVILTSGVRLPADVLLIETVHLRLAESNRPVESSHVENKQNE